MSQQNKSLVKKLVEVMAATKKVKKTGWNAFQKYEYVTEADLLDAIKEELSNRNIFVTTSVTDFNKDGELVFVKTKHTFIDAESGETLEVLGAASGHDKLDKAIFKAQTGAMKYFIMKNFLISTGDDPESDVDVKLQAKSPAPTKTAPLKTNHAVVSVPGGNLPISSLAGRFDTPIKETKPASAIKSKPQMITPTPVKSAGPISTTKVEDEEPDFPEV